MTFAYFKAYLQIIIPLFNVHTTNCKPNFGRVLCLADIGRHGTLLCRVCRPAAPGGDIRCIGHQKPTKWLV